MVCDVSLTVQPGYENDLRYIQKRAAKEIGCSVSEITALVFRKKSVDARHGTVKLHLRYTVYIGETPQQEGLPVWQHADASRCVIVIGGGPAGLFACLRLLEEGITPVLVERGPRTDQRRADIAAISVQQHIKTDSNYCFGEGGAGTFSDGKLYTRSTKRGNNYKILRILNHFGASDSILTDAHPHIGSDKLPAVIGALCDSIAAHGGVLHFNSRCTDFLFEDNAVVGVVVTDTCTGAQYKLYGEAVILATGHSANDIYHLLAQKVPACLESKTFAAGVRVEHPRALIDHIQYHGRTAGLPAAEYRLTAQCGGRGVYSFCMCPGGFVVPAASADGEIVVNGMSASGRNSRWSNAAIVVEIRTEDVPQILSDWKGCPKRDTLPFWQNCPDGLYLRTLLEQQAQQQGNGQQAPAQRLCDFLSGQESRVLPDSSYAPGLIPSRLDRWLPVPIVERLRDGFTQFEKKMHGFISNEAVIIGVETRTSSPVRIRRLPDTMESSDIARLFPCGEGAGYSGGIISSAIDGEKAGAAVCAFLQKRC